jgi:hypothetical protein
MVLLRHVGRASDGDVHEAFATAGGCSAWADERGCALLCYGDSEAACRAAHRC